MRDDVLAQLPQQPSGYRLHKLEVSNWGTFDSLAGEVHTARPAGATTLLVGQNGCGKSTLVDALLTLLVRPVVRNYNVAAGAQKQERDERSYIKGAYGRVGREEDNRAEVRYLRPDAKHYTVILACFKNGAGNAFTLAQVLHVNGENHAEKLYCHADGERTIAGDLGRLTSERLKQQVERAGFRVTTNYTEYFVWLQRRVNLRQKAMDVFNQTIAVKDIQSLNRFIREHMLEPSRLHEKIDGLQAHFRELSEAHQSLVRVRRQRDLLVPIGEKGRLYESKDAELERSQKLATACDYFFRQQTIDVLGPECQRRREELARTEKARRQIEACARDVSDEVRRLKNELENAGGARLKVLPHLIKQEQIFLAQKRAARERLEAAVVAIGLTMNVDDEAAFTQMRAALPRLTTSLAQMRNTGQAELQEVLLLRAEANRAAQEIERELTSLSRRQGNLPEWLVEVRRQICMDLRLPERELPFAAELVAVRTEARDWEASIEMVLRSFALSLLLPTTYYQLVTAYIDRSRLRDARGKGQRLVYLRVAEPADLSHRPRPTARALVSKLRYRDGHLLIPWIKSEIESRFEILCCESIDEFQSCHGNALTRERHVKWRGHRHEKDDREHATLASRFVLGWDNAEKRRVLAADLLDRRHKVAEFDAKQHRLNEHLDAIGRRATMGAEIERVASFDEIDVGRHAKHVIELEAERRALEEANEAIQVLKARLATTEAQAAELQRGRDELLQAEYGLKEGISDAENLIANATRLLGEREAAGLLATDRESFGELDGMMRNGPPLLPENLFERQDVLLRVLRSETDRIRAELQPLHSEVCAAMIKYLKDFSDERADLNGTPEYLASFLHLLEHIERDDLPRHERRFKERLNEKVTHEIGLLNASFQSDRTEVRTKIDLLNQCLRQLEYRPGTYMRLEPRDVRDAEIVAFQSALRECLADTFDGSPEADEARYERIEALLTRLREEDRWRERVTDVRRWFDFAARELDIATGADRDYYQDSAGQSGGEKAKLAFTILVAAIAYQYDIDPTHPDDGRFHFVVVDEMFSKVDDRHAEYALNLFKQFGLQLLIVAPLDAKARVTEPYVGCFLHVVKDASTSHSRIYSMTAEQYHSTLPNTPPHPALATA